jgi:ABC-type sugar transport system ATPase subunit
MIEVQNLTVRQGTFTLPKVSFRIERGQYAVLMGKSGTGKTTILEAICGLRKISNGKIWIEDVEVTNWSPADRNIGYMPQDLALFPTMSVRENLEFAIHIRGVPSQTRDQKVAFLANMLGLEPLLKRRIQGLSGGEAQRVALGRALSFDPSALLLDEPLSSLDAATRSTSQQLLKDINRQTGVAVLHVTHSQEEADALADVCIRL